MSLTEADEVFEVGSGSAEKIGLLLQHGGAHAVSAYACVDVNAVALEHAAKDMMHRFPGVDVTSYVGDFVSDLGKVPPAEQGRRLVAFFGSTIGNLDKEARGRFFTDVATMLGTEDWLLLGMDLVKDRDRLRRAYDDSRGVTAEFTRNILRVVNREMDADFPVDAFEHVPRWNETESRMEAWLRATRAISVGIKKIGLEVTLVKGEEILTEVSCKFTRESIEPELERAGLRIHRWFTDEPDDFALALVTPARAAGRR